MASDDGTMAFFAFPREIRDLIYTFLTPKEKTYTITCANAVAISKTISNSDRDLGIINASKAVQYEVLEAFCPNNTFRILFPASENSPQDLDQQLVALMIHVEIYIDFGHLHWERFRLGCHDLEIQGISEQVCEVLRIFKNKGGSCRITIRDTSQFISPLLRLQLLNTIKTLVGLETLLIIFKPDLRKLGTFLQPSLGPCTVHHKWPLLDPVDGDYGSIKFHPRNPWLNGLNRQLEMYHTG